MVEAWLNGNIELGWKDNDMMTDDGGNLMKKVFLILCVVAMTVAMCVGVAAATMGETEAEAKENDDFAITVSEVDSDGEIKITTYELEDLSCTIYDVNNNVIYDGPAKVEDPVTRGFSVKASDILSI